MDLLFKMNFGNFDFISVSIIETFINNWGYWTEVVNYV